MSLHTFLSLSALAPTRFLNRQSCFFLPLLVCILSKEEYLLAIRHLLFFRYFSLALRAANVLVQDGRRTKPSLSVGTDSLVSNSSSWHLFLKTLSFCKSVIL